MSGLCTGKPYTWRQVGQVAYVAIESPDQQTQRSSAPPARAAVPATEWSSRESLAAEAGAMGDIDLRQRGEDMPLGITLRVASAPAAFALPMVQRKPFKPAFLVRPLPAARSCGHAGCPSMQALPCGLHPPSEARVYQLHTPRTIPVQL